MDDIERRSLLTFGLLLLAAYLALRYGYMLGLADGLEYGVQHGRH